MNFKSKILTVLLILTSIVSISQTVTTQFILSGFLTDKPNSVSKTICEFKKKKEVKVFDFIGDNWWKVDYKGCIGYVTTPFIFINDDLIKLREFKYEKIKSEIKHKNDSINFQRRIDSIKQFKESNRIDSIKMNILDYVKDSLLSVIVDKGTQLKQSPELFGEVLLTLSNEKEVMILDYIKGYFKVCIDFKCGYISDVFFQYKDTDGEYLWEFKRLKKILNKEQNIQERKEKWEEEKRVYFDECRYNKNERDEFSGKRRKYTILYDIDEYGINYNELKIQLQRYGSSKFIRINSSHDLGCTTPYLTSKSTVKFKLENGVIVTFYHIGDIDCGNFYFLGNLTPNDIMRLKKSPIKSVRLTGTYYHDIKSVKWSTFFIDKLDCIK